ncbi:MAG: AAA family ATPase [Nitrososphaeraceae archaeon]
MEQEKFNSTILPATSAGRGSAGIGFTIKLPYCIRKFGYLVKINHLEILNCLSFEECRLDFNDNFNIIVGPNDSGKTNLFRTLSLIRYVLLHKNQNEWWDTVKQYFHNANFIGHIEIKIELSLNAFERDYLAFFWSTVKEIERI